METKFVLAFLNSINKIIIGVNAIKKFVPKHTCSLQKKMLPNLTCVLIYSLIDWVLEDGLKDNCSENFLIFTENYP